MADTITNLQSFHILATGKMANTAVLAPLERSVATDGYNHINFLINSNMDAMQASRGEAAAFQHVARVGLGMEISAAQATRAATDLRAAGIDTWSEIFHYLAANTANLTTTLDNRVAAAAHFKTQLDANGNSGLFTGSSIDAAVSNVLQSIGPSAQSLDQGKQALSTLAAKLGPGGLTGTMSGGYLEDAEFRVDVDGNWWESPGDFGIRTGGDSTYLLPANTAAVRIMAHGGVDSLTNKPFYGVMLAPPGSTLISPLTTVLQNLIESGQSMMQATANLKAAFGLSSDVNLFTYEPRRVLVDASASAQAKAQAMTTEKAILQIANLTSQIATAVDAAGLDGSSQQISLEVYKALAAAANQRASAGLTIDLTDAATIRGLIDTVDSGNRISSEGRASLTQIIDAGNTAVSGAVDASALARAAVVTQADMVAALISAMNNNTLNATVSAYTGANLDAKIAAAQPLDILPDVPINIIGSM